MGESNSSVLLLFGMIFTLCLAVEAKQCGLSAVTVQDISYNTSRYWNYEKVKSWVTSGWSGLFNNGEFTSSNNSTLLITIPGVYYVSANIIAVVGRRHSSGYYHYYYSSNQLSGKLYLRSTRGWNVGSTLISRVQLDSASKQVKIRLSGYVLVQSGWQASIQLNSGSRSLTVKAGSTFTLMYTSKPFAFPGIILNGRYQRIELTPPSYSTTVQQWYKTGYSSTMSSMSNGSFIAPSDGLYHVLTNIQIQRTTDVVYKFSILVDNTVEAVSRSTSLVSEGSTTITLECVLNLSKSQSISVSISSKNGTYALFNVYYGSSFFICLKGETSNSVPGLSRSFEANTNKLPASTWNPLTRWNSSDQQPLHFGNAELLSGKFLSSQSGFYYISLVVSIKGCSQASAKLTLSDIAKSIGPGFPFVSQNNECFLDVSLLLRMMQNDTLLVFVKSNQMFTVQPSTTLQVLFYNEFHNWPAAQLTLKNTFSFTTNKPAVMVKEWSPSVPKMGYYSFFLINGDEIKIKASGLYIASCSIVANSSSNVEGQFESQFSINGKSAKSGSPCRRNKTPQSFTCTMSTLLNLLEKDTLAVQVKMSDSSGKTESIHILASSSMSVILVGDTRSHPAFKLGVHNSGKPYVTKAKTTTMKSLNDFTLSDSTKTFFQTAAMYSELDRSSNGFAFRTGSENAFFISSSIQFQLFNDGELSSVIGSAKQNEHVYGGDQTKGLASLLSSAITLDDYFYFNVSGKASDVDFKWETQPGSIASGVYVGKSECTPAFRARIISNQKASTTRCSKIWTPVSKWTQMSRMKHAGTFNDRGFQVSEGGSYYIFLNFVFKSNIPTTVEVGVFLDDERVLLARESTPHNSRFFSVLLQGLVVLRTHQIMNVRMKCPSSSEVTLSKDVSMSGFRVDEDPVAPGLRWTVRPSYGHYGYYGYVHRLVPNYYYIYLNQRSSTYYTIGANYNMSTKTTTVSRTGIYFVSVTGYLYDHTQGNFAFYTNPSSTSCLDSAPLYYKDSSGYKKYVSLNGFVFLEEGQDFGLFAVGSSYYFYYSSVVHLSLHYMGELEMASGFSSTLSKSVYVPKKTNYELTHAEWLCGGTCGKFATANVPQTFGKYKTFYSGVHIVTFNLVLNCSGICHFSVCFVINGRYLQGFDKQSCFERHMNVTTTTIGGSELLYLKEGEKVSLKLNNTCEMTISNQSSFSMFYLGTKEALFGFSSVIQTSKAPLRLLLPYSSHRYYDYYYFNNDPSTTYEVQGWTTNIGNSNMFFERGVVSPLNESFVSSKTGVYLILVKLHVKSVSQTLKQWSGCVVSAKLAVDSSDIGVGVQQAFSGEANTLSFTSTLMLQKWQALTVQFKYKTVQCGNMEIKQGSSLAAIYLASGGVPHTWWPDVGPHIIEVPPTSVYIRTDKIDIRKLTCKAVGKYPVKYQWIKNSQVIGESSTLDVEKLNSTYSTVKCVVTMGKFVTRSSSISVTLFDPTLEFVESYSNMTFYLEEPNGTEHWPFTTYSNVVTLGVREKATRRSYYYYWSRSIRCSILDGSDTFYITQNYYRYGYNTQFFYLRAINRRVDRETTEEYYLNITCINTNFEDAPNATTTIHIKILDANDNLPVFKRPIYNATIPKNLRPGEDVIQVMATDDDAAENGKITYKLLYTSDSYIFVIDKLSGVISLSSYGLLAKPYYILSVEARDGGKPPRSGYVTVVLDVRGFKLNRTSDHPVFEKPEYTAYMIKIAPIGSMVIKVSAYDPDTLDEKTVSYSIYSGGSGVFKIDHKTGVITTIGKLSVTTYHLEITAEYADQPRDVHDSKRRKNITTVIIIVKNVDIMKPNFLKSQYKAKVNENASINTTVLQVKAVDEENSSQSHLNYSIPNPVEPFVIDPKSGKIRVAAKLDYETTKRYMFVVSVREESDSAKSSCTDVTIEVVDVNDNAPKILSAPKKIELNEDTAIGTLIGKVTAVDHDSGDNGKIKYYLENDGRTFRVDPDTGRIFLRENLSCCDVIYRIKVEVKDEGMPPRSTTAIITIVPRPTVHHHGESHKTITIMASVCGGVLFLVSIILAIYFVRRHRLRNVINTTETINYMNLPTDDDDELLDVYTIDENERRLSLVSETSGQSAGPEDHLLPSEVQC